MMKTQKIKPEYVTSIPSQLENGTLYISKKYRTTSHLCACGCGEKVALPLKPGGWKLTKDSKGRVSLYPSVGNFSFDCQSHYFIIEDEIEWARAWTEEEIEIGRVEDKEARKTFYERQEKSLWDRLRGWFKNFWS